MNTTKKNDAFASLLDTAGLSKNKDFSKLSLSEVKKLKENETEEERTKRLLGLAIDELIKSQKSYVQDLELIVALFVDPLRSKQDSLVSPNQMKILF